MSRSGRTQRASSLGRLGWTAALAQWRASGVSAEEFCRRRGLVRSTFQWWRWRLSREGAVGAPAGAVPALVPVRLVCPSSPEPEAAMEVELPSGVLLRVPAGFDERTVAGVLWALGTVGPC